MKRIILLALTAMLIVSCDNLKSGKKNKEATGETTTKTLDAHVYTIDSLLKVADQFVDKTIKVKGFVTHTCKHSGKRCFIVGDDQKLSMRIEAGGEIGGFNRELVGSELEITGVLKERRLSKEYLDQHEKDLNEKMAKEDGSAETCASELSNIEGMREWMKKNGKDHYSTYYVDGQSYEIRD